LTIGNTHDGQHLTMGNTSRWATLTHDRQHLTMGDTCRWAKHLTIGVCIFEFVERRSDFASLRQHML
jgi:hypothetical protein